MPKGMEHGVSAGAYTIHVQSTAGVHSACYVDAIDAAFDIGCCFGKIVSKGHVFVTHGHIDHIASFVAHAAQRGLQKMKPAKYYVLAHLVPHMHTILASYSAMHGETIAATIVPIAPFEEVHIDSKWSVKAFPTVHRVPSLGFILYRKHSKLREDFVGRSGQDIAALKRAGETVSSVVVTPEIAYTGDTTVEVFSQAKALGVGDLLKVKALITEATFVGDKMSSDDATSRGHIHLDQLVAMDYLFEEIQSLVLTHSSARYGNEELVELVSARLSPLLKEKVIVAGR